MQLEAYLQRDDRIVLPIGSTEQHAYLSLSTDSILAERVAVEAAVKFGWERYLGPRGRFVGMSSFGASAPSGILFRHFGITAEHIVNEAKAILAEK